MHVPSPRGWCVRTTSRSGVPLRFRRSAGAGPQPRMTTVPRAVVATRINVVATRINADAHIVPG